MNNAWASIACRAASDMTRSLRTAPLLHLFNGYSRQQAARCYGNHVARKLGSDRIRDCNRVPSFPISDLSTKTQAFSTSAHFNAKRSKSAAPKSSVKHVSAGPAPAPKDFSPEASAKSPAATPKQDEPVLEPVPEDDELTWRDYDPTGGMPLPQGELSSPEITKIFGDEVNADTGNYILSVMYWRRVSGALIDVGLQFPADSGVDKALAEKGLEYVRKLAPEFDETVAGQVWAQEESERLEEEMIQKAIKLGLYKPRETQEVVDEVEEQQGTEDGRQRTGQSVLQATRAENERKFEEEQAAKKIEDARAVIAEVHAIRGPLELLGGVQPSSARGNFHSSPKSLMVRREQDRQAARQVKREATLKRLEERARVTKDTKPPELTPFRRLFPGALFVLLVLTSAFYLGTTYTPPPHSARMYPDTPPSIATLTALTGFLALTFLAGRLPPLWRFFNTYLTIVPAYPYAVSLMGSTLRHDSLVHLASNLLSLWLFAPLLHEDIERGAFLAVCVASGATGGLATLAYNVARKQWAAYALGSSGAVLGVVGAACALHPNATLAVAGYEVPVATWMFLAVFVGVEVLGLVRGRKTTIDHAGHLGGVAMGVVSGLWLKKRAEEGQMERREVGSEGSRIVALRERMVQEAKAE